MSSKNNDLGARLDKAQKTWYYEIYNDDENFERKNIMNTFSPQKQKFIDSATDLFGAGSILTNKQVEDASYSAGIPKAGWFKKQFKVGYNQFKLPGETAPTTIINTTTENTASMSLIATNMEKQNLVPVPFEGWFFKCLQ